MLTAAPIDVRNLEPVAGGYAVIMARVHRQMRCASIDRCCKLVLEDLNFREFSPNQMFGFFIKLNDVTVGKLVELDLCGVGEVFVQGMS